MPGAVDWYTPMITREGMVTIRLKQVLMIGVTMMKITEDNIQPSKCNKK